MRHLFQICLLFIVALAVSTSFSHFPKNTSFGKISSLGDFFSSNEETTSVPEKSEIYFFGDIMMARKVERLTVANGVDYPFRNLSVATDSAYLVGNFEGAIPEIHRPTQDFHFAFSVPSSTVQGLKNFGFTHLGLANNHSYDFGVENYQNTQEVLQEKGMIAFGNQIESGTTSVSYIDLDGKKVTLIGLYAVNRSLDYDAVEKIFIKASSSSEKQIVFIHWGEEYKITHSLYQEKIAKRLVELGADLIVGHHPHVVQDISIIDSVPVFYSLGNFVFDQYFSNDVQQGLVILLSDFGTSPQIKLLPVSTISSQSAPYFMDISNKTEFLLSLAKRSNDELKDMIEEGLIIVNQ